MDFTTKKNLKTQTLKHELTCKENNPNTQISGKNGQKHISFNVTYIKLSTESKRSKKKKNYKKELCKYI